MSVFDCADFADHEQVVFARDPAADLRAIIAIHDTRLGPALGGCRIMHYANEQSALDDGLRLARGMTYKAAVAGVPFGGGKSVVMLRAGQAKTPTLIRAMGEAVERLGGRYIAGEDIGTTPADMAEIRRVTAHVLGTPAESGGSGDPSPSTALGCFAGLLATVRHKLGTDDLRGVRVAIQGLGKVGFGLAARLAAVGARLVVADVAAERVADASERLGAEAMAPDEIVGADVEVFAPCALGAVLNDESIPRLRAAVVAGAANNQLARPEHGDALQRRGILYAPDYVLNAGGLIQLAGERAGRSDGAIERQVRGIADTLTAIYRRADASGQPTHRVADQLAEERLAGGREVRAA